MSFRPSKAVESTGGTFVGTVVSAATGLFKYQTGQESVGILLQFFDDDAGALRKYPDNYSVGRPNVVQPTANGLGLQFASDTKKDDAFDLGKGSNAYRFMEAAVKSGYPEAEMNVKGDENNVSFLHLARFEMALITFKNFSGEDSKLMLPVKYLGRAKSAPAAPVEGPANGAAAAAQVAVSTDSIKELIEALVAGVVGEAGGTLPRTKLNTAVLKQIEDPKQKGAAAQMLVRPEFLKNIPNVTFDGTTLKLA